MRKIYIYPELDEFFPVYPTLSGMSKGFVAGGPSGELELQVSRHGRKKFLTFYLHIRGDTGHRVLFLLVLPHPWNDYDKEKAQEAFSNGYGDALDCPCTECKPHLYISLNHPAEKDF